MATTTSHPVPLNIWTLHGDTASGDIGDLAERIVRTYSPPGGVIADLSCSRQTGPIIEAAHRAGRTVALVHGCGYEGGRTANGTETPDLDLAVVLPPACHWASARPYAPGAAALTAIGRRALALRLGGHLVVGLLGGAAGGADPHGRAVRVLGEVGFAYRQHIVVLLTTDLGAPCRPLWRPGRRRLCHADLFVFARVDQ